MAINYSWDFPNIEVQYVSNSLSDVVTQLRWIYTGEVGGGEYHDSKVGILKFGPVASASFVAYESLTKDIVTGWTTASLGDEYVTALETSISSSLSDIINPALGPEPVVPSTVGDKVTPW